MEDKSISDLRRLLLPIKWECVDATKNRRTIDTLRMEIWIDSALGSLAKEYEMSKLRQECSCGHERGMHNATEGFCMLESCGCIRFKPKTEKPHATPSRRIEVDEFCSCGHMMANHKQGGPCRGFGCECIAFNLPPTSPGPAPLNRIETLARDILIHRGSEWGTNTLNMVFKMAEEFYAELDKRRE